MIQQNSPLTIWSDDSGRAIDLSRRSSAMGYGNLNITSKQSLFSNAKNASFLHSSGGTTASIEDATAAFTMSVRRIHLVDLVGLNDEQAIDLIHTFAANDSWNPWIIVGNSVSGSQIVRWLRMGITDYIDWPVEQVAFEKSLEHAEEVCIRIQELQNEYRLLKHRSDSITEREKEVMEMVLQGIPNKCIATRLAISRRTVEARRQKIYYKMSTQRVNDLIRSIDRLHYLGHELRKPHWIATLADRDAASYAPDTPMTSNSPLEQGAFHPSEAEQLRGELVCEPSTFREPASEPLLEDTTTQVQQTEVASTESPNREAEEASGFGGDCGTTLADERRDESRDESQCSDP